METQNWIKNEIETIEKQAQLNPDYAPPLIVPENKVIEMIVDASKPFHLWEDVNNGTLKKIIPVTVAGNKLSFWVNVKNPIYKDILKACQNGKTTIKLIRTGQQKQTRYALVE